MRWFILALIVVPLTDAFLLFEVSGYIGSLTTIGLVVLTAIIGGNLVKHQGVSTWQRVQQQMQQGRPPALEMLEGACILVAGALLMTPGFVTDAIGFLLLLPPLRRLAIQAWLARKPINFHTYSGSNQQSDPFGRSSSSGPTSRTHPQGSSRPAQPNVIDAEYKRED